MPVWFKTACMVYIAVTSPPACCLWVILRFDLPIPKLQVKVVVLPSSFKDLIHMTNVWCSSPPHQSTLHAHFVCSYLALMSAYTWNLTHSRSLATRGCEQCPHTSSDSCSVLLSCQMVICILAFYTAVLFSCVIIYYKQHSCPTSTKSKQLFITKAQVPPKSNNCMCVKKYTATAQLVYPDPDMHVW